MTAGALFLGILQLGLWLLLLAAALHLLRLGIWGFWAPQVAQLQTFLPQTTVDGDLPYVTVQIPLRNERYVASRAILAAGRLNWPAQRLEIQVLDDSDDDTQQIVDAAAAELVAAGRTVHVLRRAHRRGYKAGALDQALSSAQGEFIAVLDADFVPAPDFLRRLVPQFHKDEQLAFVQGRWSFLNEDENLLTRVQALILHGLMLIEQPYLTAQKRPLQFNGTGGIWRKSALLSAGGWQGTDTAAVTEDMDLSYRACLLGYFGRQLPEVAVPTELPATMAAFRIQQQRWVRGGAQVLRSLLGKLYGGRLSKGERLTVLSHLLRHARQPYLFLALFFLPILVLGPMPPAFSPPGGLLAVLLLLIGALILYYGAALRRLGRSAFGACFLAPLLLPLSVGLSIGLSMALLSGLLGSRSAAEFVRTPKLGDSPRTAQPQAMHYAPRRDRLARLEVMLGLLYAALAGWAFGRSEVTTGLGLGLLIAGGLLWVGLSTLAALPKTRL